MKHLPARRADLIVLLSLILSALLVAPPSVHAQAVPDSPALEVREVGWDGLVVAGAWTPIRVRVTAGRASVDGRIDVVLRSGGEGPPVAYGQALTLPAGATSEVVLWASTATLVPGVARLVANGRVLAEEPIPAGLYRGTTWPAIGVLADSPDFVRRVTAAGTTAAEPAAAARVVRLRSTEVPTSAERLNALGGLVVQGNAAAALSAEQRRALRDWVAAGNHLVLAGALHAPRPTAALPEGVLSATPLGVDPAADLGELATWLGYTNLPAGPGPLARYRAGGAPLVGTAERALIRGFDFGRGTITLLALDLDLEPLASWGGTPLLVQKVLQPALPRPGENDRQRAARLAERSPAQRLHQPVESLPVEAYPSWQVVGLILGGFALLVGPVLHLLLARVDRRGWLWALVPMSGLVLSGGLYVVGIGYEGRDVLGNVVGHVRLDSNGGPARQALAVGFFAPTRPHLEVVVPGDAPARPAGRWDDMPRPGPRGGSAAIGRPVIRVEQGSETRVVFDSNPWTTRTVALERMLGPEVGSIRARIRLEGGLPVGSVRNDTLYPLEGTVVVVGTTVGWVGALAPGESGEVTAVPGGAGPARGGYPPLSWYIVDDRLDPARSTVGAPLGPEAQRRARLVEAVLDSARPGTPTGTNLPPTVLAFTRAPVGEAFPSAGGRPAYHLTLFEQRLILEP